MIIPVWGCQSYWVIDFLLRSSLQNPRPSNQMVDAWGFKPKRTWVGNIYISPILKQIMSPVSLIDNAVNQFFHRLNIIDALIELQLKLILVKWDGFILNSRRLW